MRKKIVNWFTDFLFETYKLDLTREIVRIVIFVAVILPVILIASLSYRKIHQELTNVTFSQRQSVAYLAASALREKLDHLTDLGISLATPVKFRELIQIANWNDAVKTMDYAVKNFPSIDRIFLTDPGGTLMANVPTISEGMGEILPSGIGSRESGINGNRTSLQCISGGSNRSTMSLRSRSPSEPTTKHYWVA